MKHQQDYSESAHGVTQHIWDSALREAPGPNFIDNQYYRLWCQKELDPCKVARLNYDVESDHTRLGLSTLALGLEFHCCHRCGSLHLEVFRLFEMIELLHTSYGVF